MPKCEGRCLLPSTLYPSFLYPSFRKDPVTEVRRNKVVGRPLHTRPFTRLALFAPGLTVVEPASVI